MKAMILKEAKLVEENPLQLVELPDPEPGENEIRLRVLVCGVCHTDLHTVEGELIPPLIPVIPGHQVVGIVDKTGFGANRFKVGDRVGMAWLNKTCGECSFCINGKENLCPDSNYTGFHANGGYAEFAVAHEDFAYLIPSCFKPEDAAPLLCAGIIGYRSLRLSRAEEGGILGLYGFGAAAHIVIQIAIHRKMKVFVFSRGENHLKLARELGAA